MYLVDVCNSFSQVELGIFNAVTALDLDEGGVGFRVSLSPGERDVLSTYVESTSAGILC